MFKLGELQQLNIARYTKHGIILIDNEGENEVLLPNNEAKDIKDEKQLQVFIYKDSMDRVIATLKKPYITLNEFALLEVVDNSKIGAFLDWGLAKNLFLPYKEQTCDVLLGCKYLVRLYIDKTERLCASMKLYHYLDSPVKGMYKIDDKVSGVIYDSSDEFGYFVAVDNKYSALIPKREAYGNLKVGQTITARVTKIDERGRLTLALRDKIPLQMEKDARVLEKLLKDNNGIIYLNDKSEPEEIYKVTGLSKNAFKRAIGRLFKNNLIKFEKNHILLNNEKEL